MFGLKKITDLLLTINQRIDKQQDMLHQLQRYLIDIKVICEDNAISHGCSTSREEFFKENVIRLNNMILELKGELSRQIGELKSSKPRGRPKKKVGADKVTK